MDVDISQLKKTTFTIVPAEKAFWVGRGDHITNIKDLANCIESLSHEEFVHHVSEHKNDFATWIFDVLKNPLLAKDLNLEGNLKDQHHYVKTMRDHISWLESA